MGNNLSRKERQRLDKESLSFQDQIEGVEKDLSSAHVEMKRFYSQIKATSEEREFNAHKRYDILAVSLSTAGIIALFNILKLVQNENLPGFVFSLGFTLFALSIIANFISQFLVQNVHKKYAEAADFGLAAVFWRSARKTYSDREKNKKQYSALRDYHFKMAGWYYSWYRIVLTISVSLLILGIILLLILMWIII